MELIITEEDRQKANFAADPRNCLIATAFKRTYPQAESVFVCFDFIAWYEGLPFHKTTIPDGQQHIYHNAKESEEAPYYTSAVVGVELTFEKKKRQPWLQTQTSMKTSEEPKPILSDTFNVRCIDDRKEAFWNLYYDFPGGMIVKGQIYRVIREVTREHMLASYCPGYIIAGKPTLAKFKNNEDLGWATRRFVRV